jgi:hypothetical protein
MFISSPIIDSFSVKAYAGDKKTLLAFNFRSADKAKNLAGFTIFCQPPGQVPGYFLENFLRFADPGKHSQQPPPEKPNSTVKRRPSKRQLPKRLLSRRLGRVGQRAVSSIDIECEDYLKSRKH